MTGAGGRERHAEHAARGRCTIRPFSKAATMKENLNAPALDSDWTPNPEARTLTLPEQIAERLGNAIIRGHYEPGTRVQEQDVADAFQVSRGSVREAFRLLERDGLLQINARRGAQVTELSTSELDSISDPRIALTGLAARRAAERGDEIAIARFKRAVERVSELSTDRDENEYVAAVYAAHRTLCEASGNACLTRLVFQLAHQTLRYSRLGLSTPRRRQQSARNWRRLFAAVQAGRTDEAQASAERLIRDSRDMAVKLLRSREER